MPPGVKLVPFYDRTTLVAVTTSTVLHNLIFGCLLIFFIQWVFLGDLRSAIIVGANIPFALFFSIIILVLRGEDANLLSVGAVDFGIIVDAAVILVENIYPQFSGKAGGTASAACAISPRGGGEPIPPRSTAGRKCGRWTDRLRLILISALQVDKAVFFSTAIIVAAFIPLFTMQGVEGQIFSPMARTYGYALIGALLATFTVTPCLASLLLPEHVSEVETIVVRALRSRLHAGAALVARHIARSRSRSAASFSPWSGLLGSRLGSEFLPTLEEGNLWIRATMPPTISLEAGMPVVNRIREILLRHPEVITVVSQHGRPDNGSDAAGFFNAEFFVPLKPFDEWPPGMTKEKLIEELQAEFAKEFVGIGLQFFAVHPGQRRGGAVRRQRRQLGQDHRSRSGDPGAARAQSPCAKWPRCRGVTDLGLFRVLGQPNLNITVDREQGRALRAQRQRRQQLWCKPRWAGPWRPRCWRPTANSASPCGSRREYRDSIDDGAQPQGRRADCQWRQRLYSAERACRRSRSTPARPTSSVSAISASFRSSSACAAATLRGAVAEAQERISTEREAAERLSDRVGRRVRRAAAGEEARWSSLCRSAFVLIMSCFSMGCSIRCATA